MRGKWLLWVGVAIVAIGAATIAGYRENLKTRAKAAEAPKPVTQAEVLTPEISLQGRVQPTKVINVPAPIDGLIESFSVDVGDDVAEGQVLAKIRSTKLDVALETATGELDKAQMRVRNTESAIITARLEASRARADALRAKAEYERADKAYTRQKMLFAEGATARLTFEKTEHEYHIAKDENESKEQLARQGDERVDALNRDLDTFKRMLAEKSETLEQVKTDAGASEIRSPVDGLIVGRRGQQGDEVNRTIEDLLRIATALSAMEVVLEPTPPQLQRIKSGQVAAVHIAEAPNGVIAGTVREIKGTLVIVDFISPTTLIKPGVTAQVTIKLT